MILHIISPINQTSFDSGNKIGRNHIFQPSLLSLIIIPFSFAKLSATALCFDVEVGPLRRMQTEDRNKTQFIPQKKGPLSPK